MSDQIKTAAVSTDELNDSQLEQVSGGSILGSISNFFDNTLPADAARLGHILTGAEQSAMNTASTLTQDLLKQAEADAAKLKAKV